MNMNDPHQNCYEFWKLAKSLKINDIIALWCDVEPSQLHQFQLQTGYTPSCADAKRVALEDALTSGDLDYVDEGTPTSNGTLWIGNPVSELIQKNRLIIDKEVLKEWFIQKYEQGYLKEIPTFLNEEKQQAQLLQKQRDNLESQQQTDYEQRIADLESQLAQTKAELADKPSDSDKDLNTKSQNYAAKIVLAMAQIADLNLDSPYAYKEPNTTNSIIFDQIKTNGMRVSNQVIGNWLKLATEQSKDD